MPPQQQQQAKPAPVKDGKGPYKFRVRSGTYWKGEAVLDDAGQPVLDANNKPVKTDVIYGPGLPAGDIVETTERIDQKFNRPNSILFELIGQDNDPRVGMIEQAERRAGTAEARFKAAVSVMNQRDLLTLAEQEGVDVKGETNVDKLRALILTAAGIDPRPTA